jgi:MFS family permease
MISREVDRHNGILFLICYILIFFSVPVDYVGVVQAALCVKLGAGSVVANLPASTYLLGCVAPIVVSRIVPYRLERTVVVWSFLVIAASMATVCTTLLVPVANSIRIAVLIVQGFVSGLAWSTSNVYMFQCLGRGTTPGGRARALKLTFTWSPISAIGGSLGAQFVLNHGIPFLGFPSDFALLYVVGGACTGGVAFTMSRFEMMPIKDESETRSLIKYIFESSKSYFRSKPLALLWVAFVLWYGTLMAMPNLSLFTKQALGRDPAEFSGLIMAIRFAGKSLGGFVLGALTLRRGVRSPVAGSVLLVGLGILWAWIVPGYGFLIAFAMLGAGELGGAYFQNYVVAVSPPEASARDLSILNLASLPASLAPIIYGWLTELYGYSASFAFGILIAFPALAIVMMLPQASKRVHT